MAKEDYVYIMHMIEACKKIFSYIKGVDYSEFSRNDLIQDAVIRELEIIGEASKKISKETKNRIKKVPWREIGGMRDKLIHNYFGVDMELVWETARRDIKNLYEELKRYIEDISRGQEREDE